MIIDCKNCNSKFTLDEEESKLDGQTIKCLHCQDEWVYMSKSRYLENRLEELDQDLYKTELKLNEINNKHIEKIVKLENNLKIKKEQLSKQKILEDKVSLYEKRITQAEKSNSEQADLEIKIAKMENEIENVTENIFSKNKNIEKKANYLEMKINSYKNKKNDKNEIKTHIKSDIVNFKSFEQEEKNTKKKSSLESKIKSKLFWPSLK
ncbi:zinc-ribbon domain-containing protein [Candidatus Pelagibacter sp.]|jgi:predicted Zn finger-like uncharacterized protein|nr:zinc-ribbon domain-containing protein [Candidatus Pelagibacter sp.]|tara:strand:+ start:8 stop:631 length:624 start_codon:yes stop_codon:yes gene_type:complete